LCNAFNFQIKNNQKAYQSDLEISEVLSVDTFETVASDDYNIDVNECTIISTPTPSLTGSKTTFQYCPSDSETSSSNSNVIQPSIKACLKNQKSYKRKKYLLF